MPNWPAIDALGAGYSRWRAAGAPVRRESRFGGVGGKVVRQKGS